MYKAFRVMEVTKSLNIIKKKKQPLKQSVDNRSKRSEATNGNSLWGSWDGIQTPFCLGLSLGQGLVIMLGTQQTSLNSIN